MEKIIEEEQEEGSTALQTYLVTACTKLFFKRAPEMQQILANLYNQVLKESTDSDLRQKVIFYHRLLKQDVHLAEQVINSNPESLKDFDQFFEDSQSDKRERLFMEFNSLSVVYGKPSEKFLKDQALKQSLASEKKYYPAGRGFKTASAAE